MGYGKRWICSKEYIHTQGERLFPNDGLRRSSRAKAYAIRVAEFTSKHVDTPNRKNEQQNSFSKVLKNPENESSEIYPHILLESFWA